MNVMKQPAACYFVFIRDDQHPLKLHPLFEVFDHKTYVYIHITYVCIHINIEV